MLTKINCPTRNGIISQGRSDAERIRKAGGSLHEPRWAYSQKLTMSAKKCCAPCASELASGFPAQDAQNLNAILDNEIGMKV